jgi:hypothetical protein
MTIKPFLAPWEIHRGMDLKWNHDRHKHIYNRRGEELFYIILIIGMYLCFSRQQNISSFKIYGTSQTRKGDGLTNVGLQKNGMHGDHPNKCPRSSMGGTISPDVGLYEL